MIICLNSGMDQMSLEFQLKPNNNETNSFMRSNSLVGFYGISTIVGYLMPNPLYTYI